jgi:hypothetical protein
MAGEFYVMTALYRKGIDASLTIGARKRVDIVVERPGREPVSIDVKAMRARGFWILNRPESSQADNHFVVFVSFERRFDDPNQPPTCFVVPSGVVHTFAKPYGTKGGGRVYSISYTKLSESPYRDAWHLLDGATALRMVS